MMVFYCKNPFTEYNSSMENNLPLRKKVVILPNDSTKPYVQSERSQGLEIIRKEKSNHFLMLSSGIKLQTLLN
jgi:hypothetical protein